MTDKAIRSALLTAKRVDTKSENIADYVADLLRQGRASGVTDDLMAQADPQRLHQHYTSGNTGQPMPMDYASRMARAKGMGFDAGKKLYHGTDKDFSAFDPKKFGEKDSGWYGRGVTTDTDPEVAEAYANYHEPEQGQNIIPTFSRGRHIDWPISKLPFGNPRESAQGTKDMQALGYSGSRMTNDRDLYGNTTDIGSEQVTFNPKDVRSQFARFDPRLDHLAHLSASTGGAMELARAVMAKNRAGGQIAPSKYMPGVPRAVHKDGGKVAFMAGNHPDVPDVVYHGTQSDFKNFRQSQTGEFGPGIYMTDSPEEASDYAGTHPFAGKGPNVIPLHLSMKNPFVVKSDPQEFWKKFGEKWDEDAQKNAIAAGHDGVIFRRPYMKWDDSLKREVPTGKYHTHFVAFQPNQVKSAIGNNGNFDPSDPDITKSGGGEVDEPITAYHGSPHSFDKFDIGKIGTGEGAQSYGHGLYFAANEKVAKGYRDTLTDSENSPLHFDQRPVNTPWNEEIRARWPEHFAGKSQRDQDAMEEALGNLSQVNRMADVPNALNNMSPAAKYMYQRHIRPKLTKPDLGKGHMYKVKLNVKPEELIDWDRPIADQHPHVQNAVQQALFDKYGQSAQIGNRNGSDLTHLLQEPEFVGRLRDYGLKGIRYRDAGSRGMDTDGDPTHNYVMFHHDPVQVVDKYEYGGTVGQEEGGEVDGLENNNPNGVIGNENENAPLNLAPRAQTRKLLLGRGVRGGTGILQAPHEASLEGLPTKVSIPLTGGLVSAGPDHRIRQIARDYMASTGLPYNPPKKYAKVDPKRASRIAAAYDDMKDSASDPLTKASYDAMIKETMAQYHAAKNAGFKAEFWNPDTEEDPYKASPRLATEDVRNNHHMWVYPTRSGYGSDGPITAKELAENPLLQDSGEKWNNHPVTVNDIFRAVHDYYGHAKEGVGFRGDGEENAWRSHAAMYSPLARMAMTSETRGQNSWLNYGVHGEKNRNARTEDTIFAPQKVGILPHWVHHEGAEDFMGPEEREAMAAIYRAHGFNRGGIVSAALSLTRRFTKDGKAATMALKPKGK